jgi:hypothetical protein
MRWKTDIERHRMRRTLAEVKLKLEEALRLSVRRREGEHGGQTVTYRRR